MDRFIVVLIVVERRELGTKKPPQVRWLVKLSNEAY